MPLLGVLNDAKKQTIYVNGFVNVPASSFKKEWGGAEA